ncbi:MAG: hypothetical protein ACO33Y_01010, partial [Burkholderiaceae bacterium]
VGLQRRGIAADVIQGLEKVFRLLVHRRGHRTDEPEVIELRGRYGEVDRFVKFIEGSKRGIIRTGRAAAE